MLTDPDWTAFVWDLFVQIFDTNFTVEKKRTYYVKKNMKIKHYHSQILQINSLEVRLERSQADCDPIVPSSGRRRYSKRVNSLSLHKETRSNLKAHFWASLSVFLLLFLSDFTCLLTAASAQQRHSRTQEETVKGKWIFKALSGSKASIFVTCFG